MELENALAKKETPFINYPFWGSMLVYSKTIIQWSKLLDPPVMDFWWFRDFDNMDHGAPVREGRYFFEARLSIFSLEPKWPWFWLESRPCFVGLDRIKNRGQKWGSRSTKDSPKIYRGLWKADVWKTILSFWGPVPFSGAIMLNFGCVSALESVI